MLVVKNLSKSFGVIKALDNINFCLKKGEITSLLGPNGAGKTTLLRLLTGFYVPDCGEITLNGYNIATQRQQALKQFSYVPESGSLYPELTVFEYLQYISRLHGQSRQDFVDSLVFLIRQLDLSAVINQKTETLSKGFRRRVGIAGALLSRPEILILDEPTEGLDPNQKFSMRHFLKEYSKDRIVIISTHIMEEVAATANRVILLNKGKLIRDTFPEELRKISPDNDLEEAFRKITE